MRNVMLAVMAAACVAAAVVAQGDPQPTCRMCPGTYIPQVSEVYHIIEGTATLMLGPDIVGAKRRPATLETVRLFNGPGSNGASIRSGVSYDLKPGDVVVIPAGTGHWFTKIDDHVTYLMVRIDPDKVTPLKSEADSKAYLAKPHQAQQ